VTSGLQNELESLRKIYPYQLFASQQARSGIAFLSKFPLIETNEKTLKSLSQPIVKVALEIKPNCNPIQILAFHPLPPINADFTLERDRQLNMMAEWVASHKNQHIIVMGDFNATPWSDPLRSIIAQQKLQQSKSFPMSGTWPAFLGVLGISIDHILSKNFIHSIDGYVGPDIGSDHRPIHATFIIQ
jgi:endonuclease/exonuclease/phosphatase (EEP) superfamily protein YafD